MLWRSEFKWNHCQVLYFSLCLLEKVSDLAVLEMNHKMSILETGRMEWIYVHKYRETVASFAIHTFFSRNLCVPLCVLPTKVLCQDLCRWQRRESTLNAWRTYRSFTGGWNKRWRKAARCIPCTFSFRLRAVWLSYRENNFIRKGLECIVAPLIERLCHELVSLLYSPIDQTMVVIKGNADSLQESKHCYYLAKLAA